MSISRTTHNSLQIADSLYELVNNTLIPGTGVSADHFWSEFESVLKEFAPRNQSLLAKREELQKQIDDFHVKNRGENWDQEAYKQFLLNIGYLLPEGEDFSVTTANVDQLHNVRVNPP